MRAFKYVDLEHADAVARGSLRIGTFESYSRLETSRRDNAEGTDTRHVPSYRVADSRKSDDGVERLKELGIIVENSRDLIIEDYTSTYVCPPVYCLCLSNSKNDYLSQEKPQAIFLVKSVIILSQLLRENNKEVLGYPRVSKVEYRPLTLDWMDDRPFKASPFVKDLAFKSEDECRICWESRNSSVNEFITFEDKKIADLFERIA